MTSTSGHFVYLYRSVSGSAKYVGYGQTPDRAMSHAGSSHNDALRAWLGRGDYQLSIAGPYRDVKEGKAVEAALISALRPEFNIAPGDGPKFAPLGVPPELAERPAQPPVDLAQIGQVTGGALLVYLAPGDFLSDGRKKFDPAQPSDTDVVSNIEGVWDIGSQIKKWAAHPAHGPQVLIGIHGKNVRHRFIVGASRIDTSRWADPILHVPERHRWKVPLELPLNLDVLQLRGRRVEGVRFTNFSHGLHKFIAAPGELA
jgi:hypothetical protein